jgi:hypothetical protein
MTRIKWSSIFLRERKERKTKTMIEKLRNMTEDMVQKIYLVHSSDFKPELTHFFDHNHFIQLIVCESCFTLNCPAAH